MRFNLYHVIILYINSFLVNDMSYHYGVINVKTIFVEE